MKNTEGVRLHSAYNPDREAERYVESVLLDKSPRIIVVTEPAESYLANAFRKRLPHAHLIALRYTNQNFIDTDNLWDAVWRPNSIQSVGDFLFSSILEEFLPATIFVPWKPSDSQWPKRSKKVWDEIASFITIQTAVIRTRAHFGKRWLANSVYNSVFAQNIVILPQITKPALLACAGPSLKSIFPLNTDSLYITAVSSALSCLSFHGVKPDLCITTDGGYWSRDHFRYCSPDIPVAFPLEAAIPADILENNPVAFFSYGTQLERSLYRLTGITPVLAQRNGTVAGTAASYLLDHGKNSIIAAGLDLSVEQSFTHVRPHAFDPLLETMIGRCFPLCGILYERSGNGMALDAYARWFGSRDEKFSKRFFRVPESTRIIPKIKSASLSKFLKNNRESIPTGPSCLQKQDISTVYARGQLVASFLEETADIIRTFHGDIEKNLLLLEIVQLVAFTGYISYLNSGTPGTWREETAEYLFSLAKKVRARVQ